MSKHTVGITFLIFMVSACATAPVPLDSQARDRMSSMSLTSGELIYEGQVVPEGADGAAFRYERRVSESDSGEQTSTHLTYASDTNELVVAQVAVHSESYALARFEEIHSQTGVVSSVRVFEDGRLRFSVTRGSETEEATEGRGNPVVVGPTLFGFVLAHWDSLLGGDEIPVRFAATDQARTYAFTLRLSSATADTTTIELIASEMFVRLGIDAMLIVFDTDTRVIRRYIGRVPPRLAGLATFDADVDYRIAAARYR